MIQALLQQVVDQSFDQILAWAEAEAQAAATKGRPLTPDEIALASKSGVQQPERIRIVETEQIKLPLVADIPEAAAMLGLDHAGPAGLTLGYAILARPEALSPRLIAHEARHVYQFETSEGSLERFLREYLRQIIHHGYLDAPWEIDARQFEQVSD